MNNQLLSRVQKAPTTVQYIAFVILVLSCTIVRAERWVEYYRTGGGTPIEWDLNEIDLDSITRVEAFFQYKVRRRYSSGEFGEFLEMQANCVERMRGQLPEPRMRSTYNGTLGGEEVKLVCLTADAARK